MLYGFIMMNIATHTAASNVTYFHRVVTSTGRTFLNSFLKKKRLLDVFLLIINPKNIRVMNSNNTLTNLILNCHW